MAMGHYAKISKYALETLFVLLWVYSLSSCGILSSGSYKKVSCNFDYSIRDEEKTLDTARYQTYTEKKSDSLHIRVVVRKENPSVINHNNRYEKYIVYTYNKKTGIESTLSYDLKGKICQAYFQYSEAFVGPIYYFDGYGNITDSIDTDAGYTICWAQAMAIGKAYAKHKMYKTEPKLILTKEDEEIIRWYFFYTNKKEERKRITIDGKTGKILEERKIIII
ncbi:hypothetical protein [Porphyromonas gulae]|uniref:hypothetical protein n=1 Tax=Porphyromonas gulae TaxID=111105 RepID=UPI0013775060|nr:hypothetical protein [Porphyromonas gulae]